MKIPSHSLPIPAAQFIPLFAAFLAARKAHRATEKTPAPFPPHDCMFKLAEIAESGDPIDIYDTGDPAKPIQVDEVQGKPLLQSVAAP